MFKNPKGDAPGKIELAGSNDDEKNEQIERLADFHRRHAVQAPEALEKVRNCAIRNENVFAALIEAVEVCSLGQLTNVLFEVGGQYRRNL
jgi:methylmalonyl-CoA mutase